MLPKHVRYQAAPHPDSFGHFLKANTNIQHLNYSVKREKFFYFIVLIWYNYRRITVFWKKGDGCMNITHNYNSSTNTWEVSLSGEVDVYNAPQLKEVLHSLLDQHNSSIIIDCRDLKYIDSTGLGVLIGVLKRVKDNDGNVFIKNLKPYIKKIFTITGLDKIFLIEVQE